MTSRRALRTMVLLQVLLVACDAGEGGGTVEDRRDAQAEDMSCPTGVECDGVCVDTRSDTAHCGECGAVCREDESCRGGDCIVPDCRAGQVECDGECVNPLTDSRFCSDTESCGVGCTGGQTCEDGECVLSCPGAQVACDDECVDPLTDVLRCGNPMEACDTFTACPAGHVCDGAGNCALSCQAALTECQGTCVNLATDPLNCGVCAGACDAHEACTSGACACEDGFEDCNGSSSDGCEVHVMTDELHCGACLDACGGAEVCVAGSCECAGGLTLCGGACTNTDRDPAHCATCGNDCNSKAGVASAACVDGSCVAFACDGGRFDCDGDSSDCESLVECVPEPVCGDDACEGDETFANCPADCAPDCPGGAVPTSGALVVNEVHAAPDSDDDINCDGVFDGQYEEFIELVNTLATPLTLHEVVLEVDGTPELTIDLCLPANGAIIVYRDTRISSTACALGGDVTPYFAGLSLSNGGGQVELLDRNDAVLDSVIYPNLGATSPRQSYTRSPDYTGSFSEHAAADTADASTFSAGTCIDGGTFPGCAP